MSCAPSCRHRAVIAIAALGLPDDLPLVEVAIKKRFVCNACDRRATTVSVDWGVTAERPTDGR